VAGPFSLHSLFRAGDAIGSEEKEPAVLTSVTPLLVQVATLVATNSPHSLWVRDNLMSLCHYNMGKVPSYSLVEKILLESAKVPQRSFLDTYWGVIKKLWVYEMSVVVIFAVTLCVYPGTTANVQSMAHDSGSIWSGMKTSSYSYAL